MSKRDRGEERRGRVSQKKLEKELKLEAEKQKRKE